MKRRATSSRRNDNDIAVLMFRCGGPRFGRSQIRLNAYLACARKSSPACICSEVALVTYLKTLTMHAFYLQLANNFQIGILDNFTNGNCVSNNGESSPATVAVLDSANSCRIWDRHSTIMGVNNQVFTSKLTSQNRDALMRCHNN